MSQREFFEPIAKQKAAAAIQKVERETSAEIVITVRRISGSYRFTDVWFGSACALLALATMIYSSRAFAPNTMPIEVALVFAATAYFCANVHPLRRLLAGGRSLSAFVDTAAKSAFYELGISKTTRRTGILIFVSMFESRVRLIADVGIERSARESLSAIEVQLSKAVSVRDLAGFIAIVETLGPALGAFMPRQQDDINELPDEIL